MGQVAAYALRPRRQQDAARPTSTASSPSSEYDGLYRLEKKILPVSERARPASNYEELYRHDKVGNLTRFTDANGKVTETEYDGLNRADEGDARRGRAEPRHDDRLRRPRIDSRALARQQVRGAGRSEGPAHDLHLRRAEPRDAAHRAPRGRGRRPGAEPRAYTTTTAYEDAEHAVRVTDPRGVVNRRKLDGLDRVIEETVAGRLAGAAPSASRRRSPTTASATGSEVTDPENHTTRYDYDGLGRLVTTTDAKRQETSSTYFGDGLKASETDRRGVKKLFTYDNLGRLAEDAARELRPSPACPGATRRSTSTARSRSGSRSTREGRRPTFDLDGLGRVIEGDGRPRELTAPSPGTASTRSRRRTSGHTKTAFEYDGVNRLTKTTDPAPVPAAQTVETTYEDALNRVTTKDRRGFLTRHADGSARARRERHAGGRDRRRGGPRAEHLRRQRQQETQTDAEGQRDALRVRRGEPRCEPHGRLRDGGRGDDDASRTTRRGQPARGARRARGGAGRALVGQADLRRAEPAVTRRRTARANVTRYGYDPEGNRTSVQTPKGQTTTFDYDELGKLTKVTQPPPQRRRSSRAPSRRTPTTRTATASARPTPTATSSTMEYDELNRLKKTTQDPGGLNLVTETTQLRRERQPARSWRTRRARRSRRPTTS